eukprot:1268594-Rhodomonas_salina.1
MHRCQTQKRRKDTGAHGVTDTDTEQRHTHNTHTNTQEKNLSSEEHKQRHDNLFNTASMKFCWTLKNTCASCQSLTFLPSLKLPKLGWCRHGPSSAW